MSSFEETTDSSTQSALYSALGVTVIYHPLRKKNQKNTSKKINGSIKYEKKNQIKRKELFMPIAALSTHDPSVHLSRSVIPKVTKWSRDSIQVNLLPGQYTNLISVGNTDALNVHFMSFTIFYYLF